MSLQNGSAELEAIDKVCNVTCYYKMGRFKKHSAHILIKTTGICSLLNAELSNAITDILRCVFNLSFGLNFLVHDSSYSKAI